MFSFTSRGWPGACASLTWGIHGTRSCTIGRRQAGRSSVMLWPMFCWETSGPAIHVDVTTYQSILADHEHPFMETVFPDGCGLFQQDNVPQRKNGSGWFKEHNKFEMLTWPPNSPDLSPIEHPQTSLIHGGPSLQLTRFKGSAADILVPNTTAHLQGSSGVHALMGKGCFGSKRGTNTILGR